MYDKGFEENLYKKNPTKKSQDLLAKAIINELKYNKITNTPKYNPDFLFSYPLFYFL